MGSISCEKRLLIVVAEAVLSSMLRRTIGCSGGLGNHCGVKIRFGVGEAKAEVTRVWGHI